MGRVKRPFTRPVGRRDASLIIIATEGRKTERIYFECLAKQYQSTKVHVEVLEKLDDNSSPVQVMQLLDSFVDEFELDDQDELWMVVDRDYQSWKPAMMRQIAQMCHQKKGFNFCVSNPSFEIWLLLHICDISALLPDETRKLFENRKSGKHTYTKKVLSDQLDGFNPYKYDATLFMNDVHLAIERAEKLDLKPRTRWPNTIGTRVYILAKRITER
jgi:hypothetical protein